MPELRVRNIEPWILDVLKAQAKKHGWTLEREVQETLSNVARKQTQDFMQQLRRKRIQELQQHGPLPDSTIGIRAERDSA
jgi:plasmid stability protein